MWLCYYYQIRNNKTNLKMLLESNNLQVQEINFLKLLKQNKANIEKQISKLTSLTNNNFRKHGASNSSADIQVLLQKFDMELTKYCQIIAKLQKKLMSKGSFPSLRTYLMSNYNNLMKESYLIVNTCENQHKVFKHQDTRKIKSFQEEMDGEWGNLSKNHFKNRNFKGKQIYLAQEKTFNTNNTLSNIENSKQNITKLAASQIHQQFLGIRLIAYKMYERYNGHYHDQLHKEIELLKEQHQKLLKEITQMKQIRLSLMKQQKKLQVQLDELKKINQLVGRRYFISDCPIDTQLHN